jgi:transposase
MPKHLHLHPHLTPDALERRYRRATNPHERSHSQLVWLVGQGWLTRDIVTATGYCPNAIRSIVKRDNAQGADGLRDRRRQHLGGQPPLLTAEQQERLRQARQERPADGGQWSGRQVAAWMTEELGRPVAPQRGWDYLQKLRHSRQWPRPAHVQRDPAAQAAFKQTCAAG